MLYLKTLIPFLLLNSIFLFAQEKEITGTIKNINNEVLINANILAFPLNSNSSKASKFSTSNNEGKYRLLLQKNSSYVLEVSHLGYSTIKDTIHSSESGKKNFYLKFLSEKLEEVVISNNTSIKVRKDTITYRPKKFITGKEQKLKDVLKKLPGIDVDRSGNVTINNKAVTKILIDGKEFLTGDEKIGVNNIPANVIEEIEALDNYTKVSFLKDLNNSQQLALNIKLKKDKKKFAFGEMGAGLGETKKHILQPTLFYYSPKTNINVIGDFNNIGKKTFTIQDYVNFEGGIKRISSDPATYIDLFTDDFSQFLTQQNFVFNKNDFGAFSINHNLSKELEISGYSIVSKDKTQTNQQNIISYPLGQNLNEDRNTSKNNDFFFSLNKASLRYQGKDNLDIEYEAFLKTNSGNSNLLVKSTAFQKATFSNQNNKSTLLNFTQALSINKLFTTAHTTSVDFNHKYSDGSSNNNWVFNNPIFSDIIPIQGNSKNITLLQNKENKGADFNFNLKHYWAFHRLHHIYPEIGIRYTNQNYKTTDFQEINENVIAFDKANFNNHLDYELQDAYVGLYYKTKIRKFTFKPGVFYHKYSWSIQQFNTELRNAEKFVVLPELKIDWELSNSHKMNLRYNLNSNFGKASQLINRFTINSFNQVFRGNPNLENELAHNILLTYSKFNVFKGYFFNTNINYNRSIKAIRNNTIINGINQISTLLYTSLPEDSYRLNFSYSKKIGRHKVKLNSRNSLLKYSRKINNTIQDLESQSYSYNLEGTVNFKNASNIKIGWNQNFNIFNSESNSNRFTKTNPFVNVEYYFFKNFTFNLDYNFTYFENKSQNEINQFSIGNTSLKYKQESSLWTFTLNMDNLFDTKFLNESSFNQFLVNNQRTFIQGRTIVFKAEYSF